MDAVIYQKIQYLTNSLSVVSMTVATEHDKVMMMECPPI